MNWAHFGLALLAAGVTISFSDWLFFGLLFHRKYLETPEVWRAGGEKGRIAWSLLFAVLGAAVFFILCGWLRLYGMMPPVFVAGLIWLGVALPLTITNTLFLKYNPLLAVSHSLGWLARLVISAVAYGWLLS